MSMQVQRTGALMMQAYQTQKNMGAKDRAADIQTPQDEVTISGMGQTFGEVLGRLHAAGDTVRADKVSYFAEEIAAGRYRIDAKDIAGKMLEKAV
ncbi:hypothetical protein TAMA11512_22400 [Selenomonas sp. TAMA-11512]|uniref:flagellar biosynthesis anti-sigma factor FlgM n=1 Tax=Selenomonas sp. TAMA-11512 TaxID=3095337 RepID=UPI003085B87C|nr:hypothetical protein TAMA11512_22400 [Selenomonas sp. TAMA-11512]